MALCYQATIPSLVCHDLLILGQKCTVRVCGVRGCNLERKEGKGEILGLAVPGMSPYMTWLLEFDV